MSRRRKNPKMGDILIYTGLAGVAFLIYREMMARKDKALVRDAGMRDLDQMPMYMDPVPMPVGEPPPPRRDANIPMFDPEPMRIVTGEGRGVSRSDLDPNAPDIFGRRQMEEKEDQIAFIPRKMTLIETEDEPLDIFSGKAPVGGSKVDDFFNYTGKGGSKVNTFFGPLVRI